MTAQWCPPASFRWFTGAVIALTIASGSLAREINETYFLGTWAPKARANCAAGKDSSNIAFGSDHRAHFFNENYDWYLADDIIVLKKPNVNKTDEPPAPTTAIIVSQPERDAFNSMFLLVGEESAFSARLFRCPSE
jgi:hypothetical protein